MSQENVEVVRRAIAAINERDVDAYLALCNSDVELINPVAAMVPAKSAGLVSGIASRDAPVTPPASTPTAAPVVSRGPPTKSP